MNAQAVSSLLAAMDEAGIDSLLTGSRANIRYLTGFTGDAGWLAVRPGGMVFFTNSLYIEEARSQFGETIDVIDFGHDPARAFAEQGTGFWGARAGYEEDRLTCAEYRRISEALADAAFVPVGDMVETIRAVKTPAEIESITRAQRIAETVLAEIAGEIREGVTELDLAAEIEYRMKRHGGEHTSFDTIVAAGPNGSRPHAVPSGRAIRAGDMIIFDMGTVIDGYASDMTRAVALGGPSREMRDVYAAVLDAQEAAIGRIKAGLECAEADRIAREVIEGAGYGDRFVHSLGHGVGLEVHEKPRLSSRSKDALAENMVVTVEPGIYLPGVGGVRIEDMVAVTAGGCINLTLAAKTLIEL